MPIIVAVIGATIAYFFNKRLKGASVLFSTKSTSQEITDKLEDISTQRNINKDDTILGLKLIRQNFDDWYNEINDVLPLDKGDLDKSIQDFGRFIDMRARGPSGRASIDFLSELRQRCNPGGKQGFGIESYVSERLTPDTIYKIQMLVDHFFYPTKERKMEWYDKYKHDPRSISDEDIRKWKAKLKELTNKIDASIRLALSALNANESKWKNVASLFRHR